MTTIQDRFRLRRGTAANLAAVNEVPLDSEIVIESDTGTADGARKFKIGDGVTPWNALPYFTLVDTVIRCRLATAAALPANTYANGSSGAGATLTMTTAGVLTVDGVATGLGDVLLVANEAAAANNGVYQVTTAGAVGVAAVLTRFARFVAPGAIPGRLLTVGPLGTANANTAWQSTTAAVPTVGTTSITFARLGGIGGSQFAVAGGTADALTATFGILPALADGLQFSVRAASANATATPTFNPNSLGALTICKLGGGALLAGDIAGAGHELILRYRASPARYELLNPRGLTSVVPGSNITVDTTDPFNPVVASTAASIALSGRVATYSALPGGLGPTDAGKAYLVDADGLIYVWSGTAFPASGAGAGAGGGASAIGPHRYWRFANLLASSLMIAGSLTAPAMCEFRLRSTSGGSNLAVTAASASNTFSGLAVANLYDGSTATLWSADAAFGSFNHWVSFDLGSAQSVRELFIQARNDATYYAQTPNIFDVEYSDDNVIWRRAVKITIPAFTSALQSQTAALPA